MQMSKKEFLESRGLKPHKQVSRVIFETFIGTYNIAHFVGNKVFISFYSK